MTDEKIEAVVELLECTLDTGMSSFTADSIVRVVIKLLGQEITK